MGRGCVHIYIYVHRDNGEENGNCYIIRVHSGFFGDWGRDDSGAQRSWQALGWHMGGGGVGLIRWLQPSCPPWKCTLLTLHPMISR